MQRMIAAEFLRVGASQQSWDQNFPTMPSTWVPGPSGPVLAPEYKEAMERYSSVGTTAPIVAPELVCPPGTIKEFVNGRWQCTAVGGRVVDPESEILNPSEGAELNTTNQGLPRFVGGKLGRVLYTPIANRKLTGVRVGTLPQVVMGDVAPAGYGEDTALDSAAGSIGGGGNDFIQP